MLLPEDGDASARGLRARLRELLGVDVAVVVSDTFGRTWREGLTDVAVGAAGIAALIDHRGAVDAFGNRLETTRTAVVDELASAADLVKGKLGGVPVAVIRGLAAERARPRHRHPPAGPAARRRPLPVRRARPGRLPRPRRRPGAARRRARRGRRGVPDRQRGAPGVPRGAAVRRRGATAWSTSTSPTRSPPRRRSTSGALLGAGDRPAARRGLDDPLGAGRAPPAAPHSSGGCGSAPRRPDRPVR